MSLGDARRALRESVRQGVTIVDVLRAVLEHFEERELFLATMHVLRGLKTVERGKVVVGLEEGQIDYVHRYYHKSGALDFIQAEHPTALYKVEVAYEPLGRPIDG